MSLTANDLIQSILVGIQRVEASPNKDQFVGALNEMDDIIWSTIEYVEDPQ